MLKNLIITLAAALTAVTAAAAAAFPYNGYVYTFE